MGGGGGRIKTPFWKGEIYVYQIYRWMDGWISKHNHTHMVDVNIPILLMAILRICEVSR